MSKDARSTRSTESSSPRNGSALGSIAKTVEDEIARIARSLPDGAAKLTVEAGDTPTSKSIMLRPRNPAAAPIDVYVDPETEYVGVTLGRGTVFEVPIQGRRYSDLDFCDEIRAICLAAIRGDVSETVWFKGQEVVEARGRAKIGSREVGDSWRAVFTSPFRRRTKRTFVYEPYV
jgi:hypothetical protein